LGEGFEHTSLAHATPGFVGGDLSLLVKEAAMVAIRRILKQVEEQHNDNSEQATPIPPHSSGKMNFSHLSE